MITDFVKYTRLWFTIIKDPDAMNHVLTHLGNNKIKDMSFYEAEHILHDARVIAERNIKNRIK